MKFVWMFMILIHQQLELTKKLVLKNHLLHMRMDTNDLDI